MAPLGLTRRDVLGAFLGAPVAAACARRPPPRPPGEVVGASAGFGFSTMLWMIELMEGPAKGRSPVMSS